MRCSCKKELGEIIFSSSKNVGWWRMILTEKSFQRAPIIDPV